MILQQSKPIVHHIATSWAAIGPLIGVLIGALLAPWWDRRKWLKDKRTEEFRELLDALTEAVTALIDQQRSANLESLTDEQDELARRKHLEALKVIKTRLFVAKDVKDMELFDSWGESIRMMRKTGNISLFEELYESVRDEIAARAVR